MISGAASANCDFSIIDLGRELRLDAMVHRTLFTSRPFKKQPMFFGTRNREK